MDVQLKAVCERFIAEMSSTLTTPLKDFLAKCDVIFQRQKRIDWTQLTSFTNNHLLNQVCIYKYKYIFTFVNI